MATVAGAWAEVAGAMAAITRLVDGRLAGAGSQLEGRRREIATLAGSQLARHEHAQTRTASDLRRSAARGLDMQSRPVAMAAQAIRASGTADLRNAQSQLQNLAADAGQAARRSCVDAGLELAVAATALSGAVAEGLDTARLPITTTVAQLSRIRLQGVVDQQAAVLSGSAARVGLGARRRLDEHGDRAASRRAVLEAYDPRRQLARGWTLTRTADGRLVRDARDLSAGDKVVTTFASGRATSTVTEVQSHE